MSYSADLRVRVILAVGEGQSRRGAADRFAVSVSSAIRWVARATNEGSLGARKVGRRAGKSRLADHLDFLVATVESRPDITMPELAERLMQARGVSGHPASLSRLLCRTGLTYKKTADGFGARTR